MQKVFLILLIVEFLYINVLLFSGDQLLNFNSVVVDFSFTTQLLVSSEFNRIILLSDEVVYIYDCKWIFYYLLLFLTNL